MTGQDLADALSRLDEVTRKLRVECPWDREQDARSIVPHTVEEAYELAEAARNDDSAAMRDELGDVLFQVVFLSLLLEEQGEGDLASIATQLSDKLIRRHPHVYPPDIVHMPLALLGGSLAGGAYAAIAGALRAYTGAHEVITTIMLNFIAINLTDYFANGPWKAEGIIARTPQVLETAVIPKVAGYPVGFALACFMAVFTYYLLYRTTLGYAIRTTGLNSNAAQYAGINVAHIIVLTMAFSGFLAGMGGAIETLGVVGRYQPGFNVGLGFDGITIALLGKTNPLGVIPAAILVGAMQAGAAQMQFDAGVRFQIVDIILALMLFFVSADLIVRKILGSGAVDEDKVTLSSGWGSSV